MKKFYFLMGILLLVLSGNSQTPCTGNFNVSNNGNGGQGCPSDLPSDPSYHKDGVILIRFLGAIGSTLDAPDIVMVQKMNNGIPMAAADIRFSLKSLAADRKSAEYCFYSKNNSNLFNGTNVMYIFTIKYTGGAEQACNPISESSLILPVSFSFFTVEKKDAGNLIKWETSSEQNNSGFEVQRKSGSNEWTGLSFLPSKSVNGLSNALNRYEYNDAYSAKGITQYRIKQIDLNGKSTFSEIRLVREMAGNTGVTVFPNPNKGNFTVSFQDIHESYDVDLLDVSGRRINQYKSVQNNVSLSGLKPGQYIVRTRSLKSNTLEYNKIIVQ